MNQGVNTQAVVAPSLDPNSVENRYGVDASQAQTSSYQYSTTGSDAASWTMHRVDSHALDNGNYSSYHNYQTTEPATRSIPDGSSSASFVSSSAPTTTNVSQDYNGYASYTSSTDPYGYGSTGYTSYYNGYQQQPNQSYSQPVGAYQNTGAPYQPLSSFQNTGSYAGSASYSGTYYNPADYQTSGGHPSTSYSNQPTTWNQGNYANYASNPYPNYTPDTGGAHSSSTALATQYQQDYKQWADYYSQTEVTCAPGTENLSASGASSQSYTAPAVTSGIPSSNSLPTPSFVQSWRSDTGSFQMPSSQPGAAVSGAHDGYWTHSASNFQNHHATSIQPQHQSSLHPKPSANTFQNQHYQNTLEPKPSYNTFQDQNQHYQNPLEPKPSYNTFQDQHYQSPLEPKHSYNTTQDQYHPNLLESKPSYNTFQDQQKAALPQGLNSLSSGYQANATYQQPVQTGPSLDTRRVSKLQIPTNPRIASNLPLGLPKTDKDSSTASAAPKPAYLSVSLPKPNDNAADSMLKPGTFPKSLRGYVERALSRCKDDKQKASCQAALKEIITKATADGTLYTRDWDTEPLFPVLNTDISNNEFQSSTAFSPLEKRSPIKRSKSRWEPLPDERPLDKSPFVSSNTFMFRGWGHQNEKDKKPSANSEKVNVFNNFKSSFSEQKSANKNFQRPFKRQRFPDGVNAVADGDASSDSDKEQSLTAYYSSAMALASSAEEKKRRENRSKRFEKGQGQRRENSFYKPKNASAGNLHSRRATALVLSKNFDDSGSRAVEDIDWDSLTVKGTCQEIEKRYLRLTSAPDPSTVRPEDVLEKALVMVQTSQKNYLYKCDQLKSIRQDLTVQRIRNHLTVKVYETHARLALEVGDLAEYNQCLSQLKILYAEGIEGCHLEFAAYNLLYVILHSNNNRELLSSMSRLSDEAKKDEAVKHALSVRSAVTSGNYVMFFRLYKTAPNLNTCLMDLYVEKMRYKAVSCMSRACRPTVPVAYIAQVLGFTGGSSEGSDEKDTDGLDECVEWLKAHGASFTSDNIGEMQLDAKASSSSLFMPEPEDAVAHGDPNLAVNDFLTRTLS